MGKLSENPQPEEVPEKGANAEIMKEPVTEKEEYLALCQLVNPIAQPLASRKLARKLYKLVKKSVKEKGSLRHGLSDVMKAIRKNEKGILILAGNVSPIDVYSHIPALCEEKEIPYVFTPSREHLGLCAGYKRPAIVLMVKKHESYNELYDDVYSLVNSLVVEP
ncbi:hypothetical protein ACQ4LE_002922 [Meloidogyne hapla]